MPVDNELPSRTMEIDLATPPLDEGAMDLPKVNSKRRHAISAIPLGLLIAGASLLFYAFRSSQALKDSPSLEFEPSVLDFENIRQGLYSKSFSIRNTGDEAIAVTSVQKDCNCADIKVPKGIIAPGKVVSCQTTWDTRNMFGESSSRILVHYLTPDSGRKQFETSQLVLRGFVTPDFDVNPRRLVLGPSLTQAEIEVKSNALVDGVVTGAESHHPALEAFVSDKQAGTYRVTVQLDAAKLIHGGPAQILVLTNSVNQPKIPIFVLIER